MTHPLEKSVAPNPEGFEVDPFGYSALAWHKWGMAQTMAGFPVDISKPPTATDLKSPILWMTQAHALSEAAVNVIRSEPNLEHLTIYTKGVCHCQYHAVALMLVGLSLEIALKAMLIVKEGIENFTDNEGKRRHHRLHELSDFVPGLNEKDRAILECLTHFIYWAGKYPDPGSGREKDAVSVFEVSEKYEISAKQLFELASRVMAYARTVIDENT
jgi:HEPN domain-containing protein